MKKSCLFVLIALPALLASVGGFALYRANSMYGIFEAPAIGHETLATTDTRLRAVLRPEPLLGYIKDVLPPEVSLPSWVPFTLEERLQDVLPQELALLGGANYRGNTYDILLFVNERRGGPVIAELLKDPVFEGDLAKIKWDEQGVRFQKRGVLSLAGAIPMPADIEGQVLQYWTHEAPPDVIKAEGGHLFELTLDNRNGDALSLWAALTELGGQDFQKVLQDPNTKMILDSLAGTDWLHLQADLINPDALRITARIHAAPNVGPNLKFMAGLMLPQLQQILRDEYKMKLNGEPEWRDSEGLVYGEFTLTGFRKPLLEALRPKKPAEAPMAEKPEPAPAG